MANMVAYNMQKYSVNAESLASELNLTPGEVEKKVDGRKSFSCHEAIIITKVFKQFDRLMSIEKMFGESRERVPAEV